MKYTKIVSRVVVISLLCSALPLQAKKIKKARVQDTAHEGDRGDTRDIFDAVQEQNMSAVLYWLSQGVDVNEISRGGWTLLGWAAWKGDLTMVKYLVAQGANINATMASKSGSTALILAAAAPHFNVVRYLVEQGANIQYKDKDGDTALAIATNRAKEAFLREKWNEYKAIVSYLKEQGAR